jgi:hypothetical protein
MYPFFLPQRQHLRATRVLNFGFFIDLEICASVAIDYKVILTTDLFPRIPQIFFLGNPRYP